MSAWFGCRCWPTSHIDPWIFYSPPLAAVIARGRLRSVQFHLAPHPLLPKCRPLPPGLENPQIEPSSLPFPSGVNHQIERWPVQLVVTPIDVAHRAIGGNAEGRRMRNVDRIMGQVMVEPVRLGHGSVLIEQKREGHRVFGQKLRRLPYAVASLGREVCNLQPGLLKFSLHWLKLNHASHAVRSPGSAEKLHNQCSPCQ